MRRKVKVKKEKPSVPLFVYHIGAYTLLALILLFHLINFSIKMFELYPILPNYSFNDFNEILVSIGGPLCLVISLILSFKSKRVCGALLLLGSAVISAGFAFQSGYFLKTYLLKMAIVVLPQIISAILFLKKGKAPNKVKN